MKHRVQKAAASQHSTPHAFMLEAISEKLDADEARASFLAEAERRLSEYTRHPRGFPADRVFEYLEKRLRGESPKRPTPRRKR